MHVDDVSCLFMHACTDSLFYLTGNMHAIRPTVGLRASPRVCYLNLASIYFWENKEKRTPTVWQTNLAKISTWHISSPHAQIYTRLLRLASWFLPRRRLFSRAREALARLLPARLSFSRVESSVLPQSINAGRCSPGSQVWFPLYLPVDGCLPLLGPDPAAADQWRLPAAEAAQGKKTASAEAAAARDKICRCSLPRRSLLSIFSVLHWSD